MKESLKQLGLALLILLALAGAYTNYHFYLEPTYITDNSGRKMNRADILESMMVDYIVAHKKGN